MMSEYDFALEFQHWASLMKGKKSPFAERDTILHLILPVLNAIGFCPEMIVQGKNDNNATKKLWDVNCYQFKFTKLIDTDSPRIKQPLLVIETKSANIPFCTAYSGCESNNTIIWIPGFAKEKNVKDFLRLIEIDSNEEEEGSKNFQEKRCRIYKRLKELNLDIIPLRNKFSQLFKDIAKRYDGINEIISGRNENWTPQEREFLLFVLKDGINSDSYNFFGEVWRDCTTGDHVFDDQMTIPVLTNGVEWLFIKPDFYAANKIPQIVWHKKDGYGCITSENNDTYLKSFTIPIVESGGINFMHNCSKVVEVVNAIWQYIISREWDVRD